MDKHPNITNFAVSLIIKAVVIAARFSGKVRKRSLKRLAAMEVDAKDMETYLSYAKIEMAAKLH